jgi:hypothetical protein
MVGRVFGPSALALCTKLDGAASAGKALDMEAQFSQLTLDVIGKALFNYDFGSLRSDSPLIQARTVDRRWRVVQQAGIAGFACKSSCYLAALKALDMLTQCI